MSETHQQWLDHVRAIHAEDMRELEQEQQAQETRAIPPKESNIYLTEHSSLTNPRDWPWQYRTMASICIFIGFATGVGFVVEKASGSKQVTREDAQRFGLTPSLSDPEALMLAGACADELDTTKRYHEQMAAIAQPESAEQRSHKNAAERFGAAAIHAEKRSISCYPQAADTWTLSTSLTPDFDVYTLDLADQCAPKLEAMERAVDPADTGTKTRLKLQAELSEKHDIDC